jgi:hypothetical protein
MYKSSSLTFIYKYVFTPLWGLGFLIGIIFTWNQKGQFFYDWSRGAALMVSWALIWLIIMMVRLKNIEANENCIIIDSINGQKTIDYSDIVWISQIALIHPAMISIKYYDKEIGDYKKILVLPSISSQLFRFNFLKELDMTEYIRERIISKKQDYSRNNEPSRWIPIIYILLSGLPVGLIVNIFFSSSMK